MKAFLIDLLLAIILALTAYWLLPWWGLALAGFAFPWLRRSGSSAQRLTAAFLAGFICWLAFAGFMNQMNQGILAGRMGDLFGGFSPAVMVLITAFIGGLTYLLGSWAGLSIQHLMRTDSISN